MTTAILTYLLNSLWQVPLVFAAAWLAARVVRRYSPALEHRIWVAAIVLEALLPACSASIFTSLRLLVVRVFGLSTGAGHVTVTVLPGTALVRAGLHIPPALLTALAAIYACSVVYFLCRLVFGLGKTVTLRRQAEPIAFTSTWHRCTRLFAVHDAKFAESPDINGPITIGIRHRMLLLPSGWQTTLPTDDLDAVIAHEFAHMHRRDFAKNLLYELLSLPIAYHPVLWLTRVRITESREILCDSIAADAVAGRESYARSLLRLASLLSNPSPNLHAIGIFDANIFERRIMNLTESPIQLRGIRRTATAALCILLAVGTCASALTLRMELPSAAPKPATAAVKREATPAPQSEALTVSAEVMAGNRLTHVDPVYPRIALAAKVEGTVTLEAVISKAGTIKSLHAADGPEMLRGAALDAVKDWTYKPYLLNGVPTEVSTTVVVTFSLNQ